MNSKKINIVVAGDICINSLQWRTINKDTNGFSWRNYPKYHNSLVIGGALLLSKFVALSTGQSIISADIKGSELEALRSTVEVKMFPIKYYGKNKKEVYRINEYLGFTSPISETPRLFPIINDDEMADLVIIDDENNGFNSNEEFWPQALKSKKSSPIIIYKTNNYNCANDLWKHIEEYHIKNTIVIINGDDLRSKGVNISKGLSWERTALDFVWQMNNNPKLAFLAKCRHLIVPFGLEGAIYQI
ncbi:hypothetical protein [Clostridium grantii]|uniref:PfkB family carbohydrate kinase n=1 Tax=Clostridium grantii DSM 8605 TaxID=1121316 RepID=A0A1M5XV59_9CLOT|nr:hypothetical protein [Clostridium grantii]SHI03609.1 hypothetical protein SAMN02745207_03953 [Clostridium grantii DSM 8605]